MRKLFKVLGTIAMLALLLLSFAACDDLLGSLAKDGPTSNTYLPAVFTSYDADGTKYELTITRPGKAAVQFTPAAGDSYTLTITKAGVTQTSSGTVKDFSGSKFTLTASGNASVSFEVTISGNAITNITGTITVDGGGTVNGPGTLTPASGFVAVTGITGVPITGAVGTLALTGTVEPSNATNKTISWSVKNEGNTGAKINGSALTATSSGTVTVTATIANGKATGTPYTKDFDINLIQTFTSVSAFETWLGAQPTNTKNTAYNVALNISSLDGLNEVLRNTSNKYVSLDLSGSTITAIPANAFFYNTGLVSITIPSSVTNIEDYAFVVCTGLTAINVETENTKYSSEGGVLYNKPKTILYTYPAGKAGSSFSIPSGVTSIGNGAFEDCTSLTSITIPGGVTSIGDRAFCSCSSLIGITIPDKRKMTHFTQLQG